MPLGQFQGSAVPNRSLEPLCTGMPTDVNGERKSEREWFSLQN